MFQFSQENVASIVGMIVMMCLVVLIYIHSIKGYINDLDKKKIAKGMVAMTDDEKQLVKQSFRSIILNISATILIAYVTSLIVGYLL